MGKICFYKQRYNYDCGPTSLRMVLSSFGMWIQEWVVFEKVPCHSEGWSLSEFSMASLMFGLKSNVKEAGLEYLDNISLPVVILSKNHYQVVYRIRGERYYIADPLIGKKVYGKTDFESTFLIQNKCVFINFDVTPALEISKSKPNNLRAYNFVRKYFIPYKGSLYKLIAMIFIVSLAQIAIPFISKSIIDKGLGASSWEFIKLMIIANIVLVLSNIMGTFIQTYLVTHVTNRIKIVMLDDYILKTLSLPFIFFSRTSIGDMIQRVKDNERIQTYLVSTFFSSLVSFLFLILFSCILLYFSSTLFLVYFFSSIAYIAWTCLFLHQRKKLDLKFWDLLSQNNKYIIEIVTHMVDIKGFNYFDKFRNKWRDNIIEQHKQNIRFLNFSQAQTVGASVIMQGKDIALTYISCYYVLKGEISLGTLFAVQYILGSLNAPLYKLSDFLNQTQLAAISLFRIFDYNQQESDVSPSKDCISYFPLSRIFSLTNVSFRYPDGTNGVRSISLKIQYGKKIGIVGASGCGKSTLLKIISGLMRPTAGECFMGTTNLLSINLDEMRNHISYLLQESLLFEGTILENIVGTSTDYDETRMIKSVEAAYIRNEIEVLPKAYNTLVGGENRLMSKGQTQRLLLARALYKDADIYLFDEVANCLSLEIEKKIVQKIDKLIFDKTRIYVTHRGDALIDADLILVMANGTIIDFGTHQDLMQKRGYYSSLFQVGMDFK